MVSGAPKPASSEKCPMSFKIGLCNNQQIETQKNGCYCCCLSWTWMDMVLNFKRMSMIPQVPQRNIRIEAFYTCTLGRVCRLHRPQNCEWIMDTEGPHSASWWMSQCKTSTFAMTSTTRMAEEFQVSFRSNAESSLPGQCKISLWLRQDSRSFYALPCETIPSECFLQNSEVAVPPALPLGSILFSALRSRS